MYDCRARSPCLAALPHRSASLRQAELEERREELLLTIQGAYPKYNAVAAEVKRIKRSLELEMARHFNGRRVNLMGEINSI